MRVVALFIGIAILFFALTIMGPVTKNPDLQVTCVNEPDPNHVAIYNDAIYRRIRADTPIFYKEIPVHFAPTTPSQLYVDGKFRSSYVPWFDGNLDNYYVNWRPLNGVNNLLFVDKTKDRELAESGFHYYDIYIRPDPELKKYVIPDFIQEYCRSLFPIENRTMYPNKNGDFIPPAYLNPADIKGWQDGTGTPLLRPPQTPFYIAQYDALDSPMGKITTAPIWAHGDLQITISGIQKHYKAYWVPAVMQFIGLIDQDTSSPDSKYVYKYTYASTDFNPTFTTGGSGTSAKPNLQLETFNYPILHAFGWWTPECKPAIYLYPPEKTQVHVTVKPEGYLTYTDPLYPMQGWDVSASPDGSIETGGITYPYLYYESKIHDSAISKPTTGYVVSYDALPQFFSDTLPKLGLSEKETTEFKTYWEGKLPQAKFYFVGVMDAAAIEAIEPLTVSPRPDTSIRVRLYFEALDAERKVVPPTIVTPKRNGFVLAEWGGMVKVDNNHPFTCSQ